MVNPWPVLVLAIAAGAAHAQEPQWLTDARAREATFGAEKAVASADGALHARVSLELAAPISADGGHYIVKFKLGTPVVECVVQKQPVDLASYLYSMREPSFRLIGEQQGTIESNGIERINAGAFGS